MANDYGIPDLSHDTRSAINDRIASSMEMNQPIENMKHNNKAPGGFLYQDDYKDPFMSGVQTNAVGNVLKSRYDRELEGMRARRKLTSISDSWKDVKDVAMLNAEQVQFERARQNAIRKRQMDEEMQRAALLGEILGIGMGVGGAVLAGPSGGLAGYSVGKGLGKKIGGM